MKRAVAFLLALFIFVAPVTTLVKADVVIGDNDDIVVNENATILGRKLAMLESLSELALSGVTEYSISNTEDVDSYLDSLWTEINDAIDYLDSGEWVNDIPSNIASKYYTNLVKYRDIVNNRGEFLGFDLQNPTTSLLKTYFANDTYGKKYTSTNLYQSLDMVRALSALTRGGTPTPTPQPSNIATLLNYMNYRSTDHNSFYFYDIPQTNPNTSIRSTFVGYYPVTNYSWFTPGSNGWDYVVGAISNHVSYPFSDIYTIDIVENNGVYSYSNNIYLSPSNVIRNGTSTYWKSLMIYNFNQSNMYYGNPNSSSTSKTLSTSGTLEQVLNYLIHYFKNVNVRVNGEYIAYVGGGVLSPTLDIDGYLKLYGNDNPQQYELQPNTQIDYDQLYQVIYNAIRDNLPISQGDINYYDSHDTIYSPTIINNYGEDEGDESDLIDTILDYAVIPKFDTAIAQPMRAALTNGVVIMQNSITNVIPNEILLILGACFFLLLFAVVINRMIK